MPDFVRVNDRIIVGRQPTAAELARLRAQDVRTVIDFRHPSETPTSNAALARAAGMDYVNIPVKADTISDADVASLDEALRKRSGPFLLHCAAGPRAAGLYFLHEAQVQAWTVERALAEAARAGFDVSGMPWLRSFMADYLQRTAGPRSRAG